MGVTVEGPWKNTIQQVYVCVLKIAKKIFKCKILSILFMSELQWPRGKGHQTIVYIKLQ